MGEKNKEYISIGPVSVRFAQIGGAAPCGDANNICKLLAKSTVYLPSDYYSENDNFSMNIT